MFDYVDDSNKIHKSTNANLILFVKSCCLNESKLFRSYVQTIEWKHILVNIISYYHFNIYCLVIINLNNELLVLVVNIARKRNHPVII